MMDYLAMREAFKDDVPAHLLTEYDEVRADWHEEVTAAALALADGWDDHMLADAVGPRLTCGEVAPLLDLLRVLGKTHAAESWEQMHGQGDDDEYDDHHNIYLSLDLVDRA